MAGSLVALVRDGVGSPPALLRSLPGAPGARQGEPGSPFPPGVTLLRGGGRPDDRWPRAPTGPPETPKRKRKLSAAGRRAIHRHHKETLGAEEGGSQELETDRHEEDCCKRATVKATGAKAARKAAAKKVGAEESGPGCCTEHKGDWRSGKGPKDAKSALVHSKAQGYGRVDRVTTKRIKCSSPNPPIAPALLPLARLEGGAGAKRDDGETLKSGESQEEPWPLTANRPPPAWLSPRRHFA